jgi:hypothetical protein
MISACFRRGTHEPTERVQSKQSEDAQAPVGHRRSRGRTHERRLDGNGRADRDGSTGSARKFRCQRIALKRLARLRLARSTSLPPAASLARLRKFSASLRALIRPHGRATCGVQSRGRTAASSPLLHNQGNNRSASGRFLSLIKVRRTLILIVSKNSFG